MSVFWDERASRIINELAHNLGRPADDIKNILNIRIELEGTQRPRKIFDFEHPNRNLLLAELDYGRGKTIRLLFEEKSKNEFFVHSAKFVL